MRQNIVRIMVLAASWLAVAAIAPREASDAGDPANPTLFETRRQCNEVVGFFTVDPAVASQWVPPTFQLAIDAQGNASGALVVLHCPDFLFLRTPNAPPLEEGVNLAPAAEVHFWLMVQGPAQVIPVPGAQVTNPTEYAYAVADLVTSPVARSVLRRAGKNAILISDVTLLDQGSTQTGEITFRNGSRIFFEAYTPTQLPTPLRLGGNIWNYHVGGRAAMGDNLGVHLDSAHGNPRNVNTTRVMFLGLMPGAPRTTQVTIHAEPGTGFAGYYGRSDVVSNRGAFFRPNNMMNNSSRGELAWTVYPPTPIPVPPLLP